MICRKHRIEMPVVPAQPRRSGIAALHRCPKCTAEFRAKFAKVLHGPRQFVRRRAIKQRVLPPVIMSERWPQ